MKIAGLEIVDTQEVVDALDCVHFFMGWNLCIWGVDFKHRFTEADDWEHLRNIRQ